MMVRKLSGDGTNLTISSSNNIYLDAELMMLILTVSGGTSGVQLKDDGTEFGLIAKDGTNNLVVKLISDKSFYT